LKITLHPHGQRAIFLTVRNHSKELLLQTKEIEKYNISCGFEKYSLIFLPLSYSIKTTGNPINMDRVVS